MKGKQFNYLHVPEYWQQYWTRYPEGYTILEALINWVSQVDDMVKNINDWNKYLDEFVKTFDKNLQTTVINILNEWMEDGTLAKIINEEVFGMKENTADTNQVAYNLSKMGVVPGKDVAEEFQKALQFCVDNGFKAYLPNGEYTISDGATVKGKSLIIESNNATIKMDSPNVKRHFIEFTGEYAQVENLTLHGNNKTIKGVHILDAQIAIVRNVRVSELHGDNTYAGNGTAIGGIIIRGPGKTATIDDCSVERLSRSLYTHRSGTYFIEGISVVGYDKTLITNCLVDDVRTDATTKLDADGVKVFSHREPDNTYRKTLIMISENTIKNCAGRLIKTQSNYHTNILENYFAQDKGLELIQNHHGIDIQAGVGEIADNYFEYADFTGAASGDVIYLNSARDKKPGQYSYGITVDNNMINIAKKLPKVIGVNLDPYINDYIRYAIINNEVMTDGTTTVPHFIYEWKEVNSVVYLDIIGNKTSTYDFLRIRQRGDVTDLTDALYLNVIDNEKIGTRRAILYLAEGEKFICSSIRVRDNINMNQWTGGFDFLKVPPGTDVMIDASGSNPNVTNRPTGSTFMLRTANLFNEAHTTTEIIRVLKTTGVAKKITFTDT